MDELLAVLKAIRDKENGQRKFDAALQGVNLDEDDEKGDITDLKGIHASKDQFGIGMGLGHSVESVFGEDIV